MHAIAQANLERCVTTHLRRGRRYRIAELGAHADPAPDAVRDVLAAYADSFVRLDAVDDRAAGAATGKPYRIELASDSVDVLVLTQSLDHIPLSWAFFLEVERVLGKGGFAFVVAPSRDSSATSRSLRALAAFARLRLLEADGAPTAGVGHGGAGNGGVLRKPKRPSRLLRVVRPVIVWWANRVAGAAAAAPGDDAGSNTQVFGVDATEITVDSSTFYVPQYAMHRPIARRVLSGKTSEPELHRFVAETMKERPGSMVHAGVFFGDMLPGFAARCPGTVYAFEPVAENYLLARETVEKNDLSNVLLVHAGLGDRPQIARVETSDGTQHWGGGSQIVRDDRPQIQTQQVPILSIDQFDIDDLTLIQLDVEGHELLALEGARRTIEKCRPAIVVEDFRRNCEQLLSELGYRSAGDIGARDHLYLPA